jgi:carbonic anhydrase/acetyltransferase-like protein (isoleucine patch superfamily)
VPNSQVVIIAVQGGLTIAAMAEPLIVTVAGHTPQLDPESWVAPNASLIGQVRLAARVGVWYSATLRAEAEVIDIGAGTNIQDGVTVHVDPGFPVHVGAGVSVGHNAVLHGCTIGDGVLVGMGAIVLNAAVIGEGSLVAAGALITQGMVVPPRTLVAGVPGKVRRELSAEEVAANRHNAAVYEQLIDLHRGARQA